MSPIPPRAISRTSTCSIIVNDKRLTDRVEYWAKAEERLNRELSITKTLRTPVNFIVHTLHEVNDGLAHGRYFFMDVANDGIALYQSDDSDCPSPSPRRPPRRSRWRRNISRSGIRSSRRFGHGSLCPEGHLKETRVRSHQSTERLYHCVLLVCTFYTPHVHNLGFLRTQAERLDPRLIDVWPRETRRERAMFEKLKEAYVKARYSKHYRIAEDELAWLGERVEELGSVVQMICVERLGVLGAALSRLRCGID